MIMTPKPRLICLDACVWVGWLTPEQKTPAIRALMDEWASHNTTFIAPSMMIYEVMSAVRKKLKHGGVPKTFLQEALKRFYRLPILLYQSEKLMRRSFDLAEAMNETVLYDATYLALAVSQDVPLFTGDRKFYEIAKKHYAGVQFV